MFVRHGYAARADGRCIGHTDLDLSSEGRAAVEILASAWTETTGAERPDVIFTSDLRRARDSAAILAAAWRLPEHEDPRLREMHFGDWDGRSWSSIEATDGVRFRAWTDAWADIGPPGGERLADLDQRVREWLDVTLGNEERRGQTIAVVSHAGWIRTAVSRLLGRPLSSMFEIRIDYAEAIVIRAPARQPSHGLAPR